MPEDATPGEIMAGVIARAVKDGEVAIIGANSAIPLLGLRLAQETHAPDLTIIAGGSGAFSAFGFWTSELYVFPGVE